MVNRPKAKGTAAESAVAAFLRDHGWPHAERRSLNGATDKGDITGTPGIAWEVKYAGSGLRMAEWLTETQEERGHARADHGILIVKPRGKGDKRTGEWFAVMPQGAFRALKAMTITPPRSLQSDGPRTPLLEEQPTHYVASRLGDQLYSLASLAHEWEIPVITMRPRGLADEPDKWYSCTTLHHMTRLLRAAGYGTPEW